MAETEKTNEPTTTGEGGWAIFGAVVIFLLVTNVGLTKVIGVAIGVVVIVSMLWCLFALLGGLDRALQIFVGGKDPRP